MRSQRASGDGRWLPCGELHVVGVEIKAAAREAPPAAKTLPSNDAVQMDPRADSAGSRYIDPTPRSLATRSTPFETFASAAAGDRAGADSLYRAVIDPRGLRDNDHETKWVLRTMAQRRLSRWASAARASDNDH